ncbi:hypothetical protein Tco_0423182, partial [Tanacetum coccineum]
AEVAEVICLRAEASNLGAVKRFLWDEMDALKERNTILEKELDALDVKVTELEASSVSKERELTDLNALVSSRPQVHEMEISSSKLQEKITVYENCMDQHEKFQ